MKVLYDHQIFTLQKYGGISRYFYELIKNLEPADDVKPKTSLLISNNYYLSDNQNIKHTKFFPNREFRGKTRLISPINKINSIYHLKNQKFDIFHPTYYDPYFFKYLHGKPFVLTVFDMIHEKFPDVFPLKDTTSNQKKCLAEKASKIIAISKNTKKDLVEIFGIEESKIEVIYLGNSMVIKDHFTINLPKYYILFVGSREGYKNFKTFTNGIKNILIENPNLSVVCAGGGQLNNAENLMLSKQGILDRFFQYDPNDQELAQFYKKATLFVFPSLYEGFGIPILESYSCKCPLLCSNTSSLPEIAGNGAIYFDPTSESSISNAVKRVLDSKELRDKLITNGTKRLKYFSWEKTVTETQNVYQSIVK